MPPYLFSYCSVFSVTQKNYGKIQLMDKKIHWSHIGVLGLVFIIVSLILFGLFVFSEYESQNEARTREVITLQNSLRLLHDQFASSTYENKGLAMAVEREQGISDDLSKNLETEQQKNTMFESQIRDISSTVGVLQKLSQTDKELLSKYSKVYFLNENYIPSRLTSINVQYLLDKASTKQIHAGVDPFLSSMMDDAARAGIDLKIISAYRSFEDQMLVKTGYKMTYGSGANQFSADQGYSEHQLGTTLDFSTSKLKTLSTQFDKTDAYTWLSGNAYKFGFILSYPKGNSYYQYEPWHWRFIGIQLATRLHDENKYFYDLTQREINNYLANIFDK